MKMLSHDPELTELATNFTVRDYKDARDKAKDSDVVEKNRIADAIRLRFRERYIHPASDPKCKHGFTMMAISCLMIEALESFRQGWKDTNGRDKGKSAFCYFFDSHDRFKDFRGSSQQFYKNVRCGILHQAETTGGWRITRNTKETPFFDPESLTINATRFLKNLSDVLDEFCDQLKTAAWESTDWKNAATKLEALCDNCHRPQQ
jgi:hypothetical protein